MKLLVCTTHKMVEGCEFKGLTENCKDCPFPCSSMFQKSTAITGYKIRYINCEEAV